jgi:hypothetical protein
VNYSIATVLGNATFVGRSKSSASGSDGAIILHSCIPCPVGYCCNPTGTPLNCPLGYYCLAGISTQCPSGFACPASTNISSCPPGTFAAAGAPNCTLCSSGTFAASSGSASCQQCPGGHYCPAGTSLWARLNCGKGNYCPDGSGAPKPCPYQVPPSGGWGALRAQGPAFLVETAHCLNHCFWNYTAGDGKLSKC